MTRSRHINRPKFRWDADSEALLRALNPDFPSQLLAERFGCTLNSLYNHAFKLGLKKSAAYLAGPHAQRLRRGDEVGKAYRFPKGHVPANKGQRRPGWAPGRMADTQFKKGSPGTNTMPIGSTRMIDGYQYTKISDVPYMPYTVNWKPSHVLLWESVNGPLPAGHCLCFRDRDRLHIELDNLELITRAERMRRNTIHRYPAEVKKAIRLVGKLKRTIEARDEKQD